MNVRLPLVLTAAVLLAAPAAAKTFTSADRGHSLNAPDAWTAHPGLPGTAIAIDVPGTAGAVNLVTTVAQDLPEGMDLSAYMQATVESLPQMMPGAKIGTPRALRVGGLPASEVEFSGKRGARNVYGRVLLVVKGQKGYTVSYLGEAPNAATKAAIGKTLASFKLTR